MCTVEQAVVKLNNRAIKLINKLNIFIPNYKIYLTYKSLKGMYNLVVKSDNSTISDLFKYVYLLGHIMNCIVFGYSEKPTDRALDKVVNIVNNLDLPYYVRYIIKMHMICRKDFVRVKKALEGTNNIKLRSGNTQEQRFDLIAKYVSELCKVDKTKVVHIVDIGCGEGYYVRNLIDLINYKKFNVIYHAHDKDEFEMDKIDILLKNVKQYSNVKAYRSFRDMIDTLKKLDDDSKIMIIFSEVIEHIPCNEVKQFMIDLIDKINFKMMLITTPQSEFNKHYLLSDGEFRHPDHKQEFTRIQFETLMSDIIALSTKKVTITTEYLKVGDTVNDIPMSQGMILRNHVSI